MSTLLNVFSNKLSLLLRDTIMSMEIPLPILLIVLLGFAVTFFFLNKKLSELKKQNTDASLLEWLKTMQQSIDTTNKSINQSLHTNSNTMISTLQENTKQLNERLDK